MAEQSEQSVVASAARRPRARTAVATGRRRGGGLVRSAATRRVTGDGTVGPMVAPFFLARGLLRGAEDIVIVVETGLIASGLLLTMTGG